MTESRPRVLYVGGLPRSGSTLTDLMLHQLPGHVGVGELFYVWRNGVVHDNLCACGERFHSCPFWTQVGEHAFGGWSRAEADRIMRLQDRVDVTSAIPLLLSPRRPRAFRADLEAYGGVLTRLYSAVLHASGGLVVVDSSKRPSMAYALRAVDQVTLAMVHVVRDPRGVAFSFQKQVPLPDGVALKAQMPQSSTRKVARRWVTVNLLIELLGRLGVPQERIKYEELITDPQAQLARVLRLSGCDATTHLDFVRDAEMTIPSTHLVAAGRIRLNHGAVPLRLDDQWRTEMPPRARRLVTVVTTPLRARYGYH